MLWQQNRYRENAFVGSAAYGFFRPARLGQVADGGPGGRSGFMGPFGVYSDYPRGYFQSVPPPGFPRTTGEIATPEGYALDEHCYRMPDGSFRRMMRADAVAMRDAAMASGDGALAAALNEPVDPNLCGGVVAAPPQTSALMAGKRVGQAYPAPAAPAPVAPVGRGILYEPAIYGIPVVPTVVGLALVALLVMMTGD